MKRFFTMNEKTEVNMTIGIDKIGFATSQYVLKLQVTPKNLARDSC